MRVSGRKAILFVSPLIFGLFAVGIASAKTVIKAESYSENGSSASTSIDSSTTTNNSNDQTTAGSTDVTIICNGVKKTYHSDSAENVDLHCDDDITGTVKTQVNIKNNVGTTITPSNETSKSAKMEEEKVKQDVKAAEDRMETDKKDLFEKVTELLRSIFKSLHF
jgi:hypothetical protein